MSIQLKKIAGKSLIYHGTEDNFYKNYSVVVDNKQTIIIPVIINKRLKDYQNEGKIELINSILSDLNTIKLINYGNDLNNYQNENGLTVFVLEVEKYLVIISKGEVNRGIFKIVVEGIFKITPPEAIPSLIY